MSDDRDDDPDRAAILARRNRLVVIALSGISLAGCDSIAPRACLEPPPVEPEIQDPAPQPCLEPLPVWQHADPMPPCLSVPRDDAPEPPSQTGPGPSEDEPDPPQPDREAPDERGGEEPS